MSQTTTIQCDGCGKGEEKTPLFDSDFADKWVSVYVHHLLAFSSFSLDERSKHYCGECWKAAEAAILGRVVRAQ